MAAFGPRAGIWLERLMAVLRPWQLAAGFALQARPLEYDTAFTGMGSNTLAFRALGVMANHRYCADPKPASKQFVSKNALMGRHHYECISSIIDPGGSAPVCSQCRGKCSARGGSAPPDMP